MSEITLKVDKRTEFKKSTSNQMRKAGFIPGIYYIHGGENIAIKANELSLRPIVFTSESSIINLEIEGEPKSYSCVLKGVQFDPLTTRITHFDLLGLKEGEKITLEVTVTLNGNAPGVREGGLLQFILHKLNVSCLPKDIPSHIDIDISNLNIGDSIKVSDIKIENVEVLNEETQVIVQVVPPAAAEVVEETPAEGETPAEPEVITKGKKEEESE
jgi:large subunit ribosomal protein L25